MYSLLKSLRHYDSSKDYVLAIITGTNGSTYRKSGAMMLIDQDSNHWGLLSGGCLEGDIVANCKTLFENKCDHQLVYNMRDEADLIWGMGLGCDGEVTIFLKYLPAEQNHFSIFEGLFELQNGNAQQITINTANNNELVIEPADKLIPEKHFQLKFELRKPHHLLICGASPDVPPVVAIAHHIGWKTTVIDHRQDASNKEKFPFADELITVKRSQWNGFELTPFDSAVIMSHQFERDQEYLKRLLDSPIGYIGLLGPSARRDKLLAECDTHFSEHQGRVFGPIGLDIGAGSPETIALAIISEIQAVAHSKSAKFCYEDLNR